MSPGRQALTVASTTRAVPSAIGFTITRHISERKGKCTRGSVPPNQAEDLTPPPVQSLLPHNIRRPFLAIYAPKDAFLPHPVLTAQAKVWATSKPGECAAGQSSEKNSRRCFVSSRSSVSTPARSVHMSECVQSKVLRRLAAASVSESPRLATFPSRRSLLIVGRCDRVIPS